MFEHALRERPGLTFTDYYPSVIQVIPQQNHHVIAYFNDGRIVDYQVPESILKLPAFQELLDNATFSEACCVLNGTIAWDLTGKHDPSDCIDIDPCEVYDAPCVNDIWANE